MCKIMCMSTTAYSFNSRNGDQFGADFKIKPSELQTTASSVMCEIHPPDGSGHVNAAPFNTRWLLLLNPLERIVGVKSRGLI